MRALRRAVKMEHITELSKKAYACHISSLIAEAAFQNDITCLLTLPPPQTSELLPK